MCLYLATLGCQPTVSSVIGGPREPLYMKALRILRLSCRRQRAIFNNQIPLWLQFETCVRACDCRRKGGCRCVCLLVPVLIRIYTTGPGFNVVSCIAHYRYLPPGLEVGARDKQRSAVAVKMRPGD